MSTTRNFFSYTVAMADDTIVIAGDASHGTILTTLAGVTWNVSSLNADGSVNIETESVYDSRQNGITPSKTTDYTGLIEFWAEPGEYRVTITDPQARVGTKVIYWSSVSGQAGAIPGTTISNDEKIVSNQIAASAIGTEEIAASAVTTAKIADGTIVNADLSSTAAIAYSKLALTNSISTNDFVASGVTTHKIVASGVTTDRINDAAVTTDKIAASGVTTHKINDSAVTENKIVASGVTTHKINDAAVTPAKLATAAWTSGYTPTIANWTKGNSTIVGRYQRIQNTVFVKCLITTGTTAASVSGHGIITFTLPVPALTTTGEPIGTCTLYNAQSSQYWQAHCVLSAATGNMFIRGVGMSDAGGTSGTTFRGDKYPWSLTGADDSDVSTLPELAYPWGNGSFEGSKLSFSLCYEAA